MEYRPFGTTGLEVSAIGGTTCPDYWIEDVA
jgi:hypothetical protein